MENLEETGNLLEKYRLPAEPEEVDNTNRPGTRTKTETVIEQLWTHRSAGPDGVTGIPSNI